MTKPDAVEHVKPLFIPLKAQYFDAFDNGSKDIEYRPYGPRWNERTCRPGREVTLSRGYGKQRRLRGVVRDFRIMHNPAAKLEAWAPIYGRDDNAIAACIVIRVIRCACA